MKRKEKYGYWNAWELRKSHNCEHPNDEDKCVCGHPRFMHNHSSSLGITFCKVHGCRYNLYPCKRFKLKGGKHGN